MSFPKCQIIVRYLSDLNQLLQEYEHPGVLYLPFKAYNIVYERVQSTARGQD